mmetsp:Transcript_28839/g.46282  ORF Transcript_28839/g.46282 Transcript_28839/m.46282 type:complete len:188 (-) Transcript_28839:100-663(-)
MGEDDGKKKKKFAFPKFYDFPPFFTIQPVQLTREKQFRVWVEFIRDYQSHVGSTSIDVSKASTEKGPPFRNPKISRGLSEDGIRTVLNEVVKAGYAVWADEKQLTCRTTTKKLDEWGNIILAWAKENGQLNRISTLNELRTENEGEEFQGMEPEMLHAVLKAMQDRGLAQLFPGENLDELGFKLLEN